MAKSLRLTWVTAAIITGAVCALSGCTGGGAASSLHVTGGTTASPGKGAEADNAPSHGTAVCGQQVLQSPWTYDGTAGTFTASNAPSGLPTFGSAGTDFPSATQLVVVPAGNNTSPASSGAYGISNAVIYFEPGEHQVENGMNTGHDSAYVGGYTQAAGKAV